MESPFQIFYFQNKAQGAMLKDDEIMQSVSLYATNQLSFLKALVVLWVFSKVGLDGWGMKDFL